MRPSTGSLKLPWRDAGWPLAGYCHQFYLKRCSSRWKTTESLHVLLLCLLSLQAHVIWFKKGKKLHRLILHHLFTKIIMQGNLVRTFSGYCAWLQYVCAGWLGFGFDGTFGGKALPASLRWHPKRRWMKYPHGLQTDRDFLLDGAAHRGCLGIQRNFFSLLVSQQQTTKHYYKGSSH